MAQRKTAWLRAAVPAAVLAMALTACGSGDSEASDDASASGNAETTEPAGDGATSTEDGRADNDDAQGGGTTATTATTATTEEAPESSYSLGEPSDPLLYGWGHGGVANFAVTVDSVHIGTSADIPGGAVKPVSVYFTVEHTSGEDVHDGDLGSLLRLTYPIDGLAQAEDAGFEAEGGCPADAVEPEVVRMGEEFSSCRVVLIPEDVEPVAVLWGQEDTTATWRIEG